MRPRSSLTVRMLIPENRMKVIGLAGWSGAGKTTLLARLIPHFNAEGLRVSVIKHAHHDFDVDIPGKDSWVHRRRAPPKCWCPPASAGR
jgi:molybdopterin-guanine dinucleotide biosynthesis adapter protein